MYDLFYILFADVPTKVQLPLKSEDREVRRSWLENLIRKFLREFVFDTQE